jgi:asparagine synthase (glutamine-hydrolysing)
MCGIWGLLSLNKISYNVNDLFIKFNTIKERGPDKSTFIVNDNYIIGFHRLAIMDTSVQGDQPFSITFKENNRLRTVYLTCNGEIYNFKELKESIEVKEYCEKINYNYRSNSDCEVLLVLYLMSIENSEKNLDDMLNKLNGEFAFAVFDITENLEDKTDKEYKLWLARDRFGIRPLFYSKLDDNTIVYGSEMKSLVGINNNNKVEVFDPRSSQMWFKKDNKLENISKIYYSVGNLPMVLNPELSDVYRMIRDTLISSVKIRLQSDREIGCLLSGGLDSSLVASIAATELKKEGKQLRTFSIGMPDSPDVHYAKIVAKHIDSIHTNIEIPDEIWVKSIEKIVKVTETFDITTIRASTGQYLISKWISENTDIKVLLIGDGSDEATGGYLYFHKAPNDKELHFECKRLLHYIHYFDVLRADRGVASNGLEARVPYLDYNFIDLYMHIDSRLRVPTKHNNVIYEKYLLRKAFHGSNYLPECVLWRRKEAFSDGISSKNKSWYEIIQEKINLNMSDEYFEENRLKYKNYTMPHTKEALYYHEIYDKYYPNQYDICPYYWLPKWIEASDPSARTLKIYKEFDKEIDNKITSLKIKNE